MEPSGPSGLRCKNKENSFQKKQPSFGASSAVSKGHWGASFAGGGWRRRRRNSAKLCQFRSETTCQNPVGHIGQTRRPVKAHANTGPATLAFLSFHKLWHIYATTTIAPLGKGSVGGEVTSEPPLQWRQNQDGRWQYLAPDGYWYEGNGPPPRELPAPSRPFRPLLAPPATAATASSDTLAAGAWLAIVGGFVAGIGTLLPWMTFTGFAGLNRNAFQLGANLSTTADGPVLLILAIVTVVNGITRLARSSMPRFIQRSTLVTGVVMLIWVALEYSGLHSFVTQHSTSAILGSVGYGY
jgi:hypothetical protein